MWHLVILALIALCLLPARASAQSCTYSVSNVVFGNVDALSGAAVDGTGQVEITCSGGLLNILHTRVCLNLGAGSGGATSGVRRLSHPDGDSLDFRLFQDPARTIPWGSVTRPDLGDPVAVTFFRLLPLTSRRETVTIYARILGGQQAAPAGTYSSSFVNPEIVFNHAQVGLVPDACSSITGNPQSPSFTVLANVPNNCSVIAQDMDFGSHGVLREAVDATGGVEVTCTTGTPFNVGLNNGLQGQGPTQRRMTLGGETITYGLYQDAARSLPWGDTIGVNTQTGVGAGGAQQFPVYGRVPAQRTPRAGTYRDTVVVTVTY